MGRVLAGVWAVLAYGAFLGSIVYLMGFLAGVGVPRGIDDGVTGPVGLAVAVNLGLVALFGLQHSVMARPAFKRRWARVVPEPLERSTFVVVSSLMLVLLFWGWHPLPGVLWDLRGGTAELILHGVYWAGWGLAVASTFVFSHTELFGLQQVHAHVRGRPVDGPSFRTPFLYRVVRHPMHLGMLVALWAAPVLSQGRLLFAAAMTLYLVVGIHFEERELIRSFGDRYRAYRREVPAILPLRLPRALGRRGAAVVLVLLAMGAGVLAVRGVGASEGASGGAPGEAFDGAPAGMSTEESLPSPVSRQELEVGGLPRTYLSFLPDGLSPGAPLLVVLHGSGGSGDRIRGFVGERLEAQARREGFAVVYPDGFEGHWNDCRSEARFSAKARAVDDVAFLEALVRRMGEVAEVDPLRVRVLGYSNGGHMAFRIAMEAPRRVQGIAVFGASLPVDAEMGCELRGAPAPVFLVNGTGDPVNPWDGGEVVAPGGVRLGRVRPSAASAAWFARRMDAGDGERALVALPPEPDGAGTPRGSHLPGRVEVTRWATAGGVAVVHVLVPGGGHTIPGPGVGIPEQVGPHPLGPNQRRFDALAEALEFFRSREGAGPGDA